MTSLYALDIVCGYCKHPRAILRIISGGIQKGVRVNLACQVCKEPISIQKIEEYNTRVKRD